MWYWRLFMLACFAIGACAESVVPTSPSDVVSGTEASDSDAGVNDAVAPVADTTEDRPADVEAPPVVEAASPVVEELTDWLVSYGPVGSDNTVAQLLELGVFAPPEGPGVDAYGIEWLPWDSVDGALPGSRTQSVFAVARIETAEPARWTVQAERVRYVWVNGAQLQPGEPYGASKHRTAAIGDSGTHVISVRVGDPRGGTPRVVFRRTPDPIAFNTADLTWPHLREGTRETQWLGLAVLNLSGDAVSDVALSVVASVDWQASTLRVPSLGPGAATQVPFELIPAASWDSRPDGVPVTLELSSPDLPAVYRTTVTIPTVAEGAVYRRTRLSPGDGSVQHYGVNPPTEPAPEDGYALVLSLHGASVEAQNQAGSYGSKSDTIVVAPTNRRPFGFDWEEWGRMDGREAFEHAKTVFHVDPTRQYVTGHSMGGHGAWQFGVLFPDRFALVGPSAGWPSFYVYPSNSPKPSGAFSRSQASSDTLRYLSNLAEHAVYIIHGTADDNVPFYHGQNMADALSPFCEDLHTHWEQGAGHWWDGYPEPGTACVDWPPMFELMEARRREVTDLAFDYLTPGTWVNERFSYVTLLTALDPNDDIRVVSSVDESGGVSLTTTNAYAMKIDTAAIQQAGATSLVVNGQSYALDGEVLAIGPQDGKTPAVHGPYNQVYTKPFCFAYAEDPPAYRQYAAYLLSRWNIIGNGHGCALPVSRVTPEIRAQRNIIWLGVSKEELPPQGQAIVPFEWADGVLSDGVSSWNDAALISVFPADGRLNAVATTSPGSEYLLFRLATFHSGFALPDYLVWDATGGKAAGFYGPDWAL